MTIHFEDKTTITNNKKNEPQELTSERTKVTIKVYGEDIPLQKVNNCDYTARIVEETYSLDL